MVTVDRALHVVAALAFAAAGSCAGPGGPSGPSGDPMLGFLRGMCPSCCPDWGCGTNGAWLGQNIVFHELDGSGHEANRAGLRVDGFHDADGQPLRLEVERDVLRGVRPNGAVVADTDLIGATIDLIRVAGTESKKLYRLKVRAYGKTTYWVDPGETVPVYAFTFEAVGTSEKVEDLCRDPADGGTRWEPIKGMAVIFTGDRYDERDKTVTEAARSPWFNIACAGTTVAKMHLLRHTVASDRDGHHATTVPQRQAVLKMLVADYCGKGKPFTVDGHALTYSYDQDWEPEHDWPDAVSLDAVWDDHHAVCLNVPRLKDQYAQIRTLIVNQCAAAGYTLKPCGTALMSKLKTLQPGDDHPWKGYAVSANP